MSTDIDTGDDVTALVDRLVDEREAVLFIKGEPEQPRCHFSQRAVGLVSQHRDDVETVNVLQALDEFRAALEPHSGRKTIPQLFVDGEFVGGSDIIAELEERGELGSRLAA